MKPSRLLLLGSLSALLLGTGCLRLVTAPLREEREEKAQAAFARLAAIPPEQMARFMTDRLRQNLTLTAEQAPRVEALNLTYATALHAAAVSTDSVRAKTRVVRAQESAKDAELKSLLTSAQFSRYEELREQLRTALRDWSANRP